MKLIRFGNPGSEKPGVMFSDDSIIDVSSFTGDFDRDFFESGKMTELKKWLADNADKVPKVKGSMRLGPPVAGVGKLVCVGLNYADHARESGADLPKEPILFFKATSAITGPNDDFVIPKNSKKSDWEVELAIVIGKKASYVSEDEAMDHIAGYCLHNDYSELEYQLERGGQWVKGKSADSFAPLGPFLVTQEELDDVSNLRLWLKVNDEIKQDGTTANLIFNVPFLVSYISQFMTLEPGDIISTGTPAGVGTGFSPPQFLKPGDRVEIGIDGLGTARQNVRAWDR